MYLTFPGLGLETLKQAGGVAAKFLEAYNKEYGKDPDSPYAIYGVAALQVILAAIEKSDGTRKGVRDAIFEAPGITIPAADSLLGKDLTIDPATGDVNVKDVTVEQITGRREVRQGTAGQLTHRSIIMMGPGLGIRPGPGPSSFAGQALGPRVREWDGWTPRQRGEAMTQTMVEAAESRSPAQQRGLTSGSSGTSSSRRSRSGRCRADQRPDAVRRRARDRCPDNGALYALIALGYTLVYGIIELINFAHGDLFMLGTVFSALRPGQRARRRRRRASCTVLLHVRGAVHRDGCCARRST